jgi:hypothetical protein
MSKFRSRVILTINTNNTPEQIELAGLCNGNRVYCEVRTVFLYII